MDTAQPHLPQLLCRETGESSQAAAWLGHRQRPGLDPVLTQESPLLSGPGRPPRNISKDGGPVSESRSPSLEGGSLPLFKTVTLKSRGAPPRRSHRRTVPRGAGVSPAWGMFQEGLQDAGRAGAGGSATSTVGSKEERHLSQTAGRTRQGKAGGDAEGRGGGPRMAL